MTPPKNPKKLKNESERPSFPPSKEKSVEQMLDDWERYRKWEYGRILQAERKKLGWTQTKLAMKLLEHGISEAHIKKVEAGEQFTGHLSKWADILEIDQLVRERLLRLQLYVRFLPAQIVPVVEEPLENAHDKPWHSSRPSRDDPDNELIAVLGIDYLLYDGPIDYGVASYRGNNRAVYFVRSLGSNEKSALDDMVVVRGNERIRVSANEREPEDRIIGEVVGEMSFAYNWPQQADRWPSRLTR